MRTSLLISSIFSALIAIQIPATAALVGPVDPPPGGYTFTNIGGVSGTEGLAVWGHTGFTSSAFADLYYGLDQSTYGTLGAGLAGSLLPFNYVGASGQTATFTLISPYISPGGTGDPPSGNYPVRLEMTVTGLGATPWVDAVSLGLPADVGAVVQNTAGLDFTLSWQMQADMGSGYIPLNGPGGVPQNGGGTVSSFATGFYYAPVPEASSFLFSGLIACVFGSGLWLKRRRRTS